MGSEASDGDERGGGRLAHGAWADGSSWAKVIAPLAASGIKTIAAPFR